MCLTPHDVTINLNLLLLIINAHNFQLLLLFWQIHEFQTVNNIILINTKHYSSTLSGHIVFANGVCIVASNSTLFAFPVIINK